MDDIDYQMLIEYIRRNISIDGNLYKERPFKRRLNVRIRHNGLTGYREYLDFLKTNKEEMQKLKDTLTINVTRFFRNRETFDFIEQVVLRNLIKNNQKIRILSAGCSTGEEPYSLSMIMKNYLRAYEQQFEIVGIDVDTPSIEKARIGIYSEFSFMELKTEEIERNFRKNGVYYILSDDIKKNVEFVIMDIKESEQLLQLGKFDLIVCRNILIYFSKDFQEKIIADFHRMLKNDGYLVLGKVEILTGHVKELFETVNRKERVFKKIANQHKNS
ncbi:MAG: protein-glutamate O-methyltransferase CheR [bacterium]|nr:protein-glutamate O-methyltransferase CheR [bacterium]